MTKYELIQRLQNSPLTGWIWNYWHNEKTGNIIMLVLWKNPGKGWSKMNLR